MVPTDYTFWVFVVFFIGYVLIAIEQFTNINKATVAILMAVVIWIILFAEPAHTASAHMQYLSDGMFKVVQVLFFLLGALTIVEIVNVHRGFSLVTVWLSKRSKSMLFAAIALVTFFLSSVLDNLTTTIVMVTLVHKLIEEREIRLIMGGVIVFAANAGGAWTPIGDVATTLLWINGQITTLAIMKSLFLPSAISLAACVMLFMPKVNKLLQHQKNRAVELAMEPGAKPIFILGVLALISVPFFVVITGLPAFIGMLFGLGIMWVVTDLMHYKHHERTHLRVHAVLAKVDMTIIVFYLGVLLSINALNSAGILQIAEEWLNAHVPYPAVITTAIGLLSSVVDNVSLVAAAIGMYPISQFPVDHSFWQQLAYCAGEGGSILIIGSAAGVAFMSIEKVSFMWYTKHIAPVALLGYFVGLAAYWLLQLL